MVLGTLEQDQADPRHAVLRRRRRDRAGGADRLPQRRASRAPRRRSTTPPTRSRSSPACRSPSERQRPGPARGPGTPGGGSACAARTAVAYGFLTPYLLVFAAFWIWPIIYSFYLSFLATRTVPWRFTPPVTWGRLFVDPAFLNALKNTLVILVIQVPVMIALATVLAVLLELAAAARPRADALRLLRAGGGRRGRLRRGVPADVQPRLRHRQQAARHGRPRPGCSGSPTRPPRWR